MIINDLNYLDQLEQTESANAVVGGDGYGKGYGKDYDDYCYGKDYDYGKGYYGYYDYGKGYYGKGYYGYGKGYYGYGKDYYC
jgi:hypothetical protein